VEKELKEPVNLCDIASNLLLLNQFTNKGNNVSDHPDYYKQQGIEDHHLLNSDFKSYRAFCSRFIKPPISKVTAHSAQGN